MYKTTFFLALNLFCFFLIKSQTFYNGNFELLNQNHLPTGWDLQFKSGNASGYNVQLDSVIKKDGKYSLSITPDKNSDSRNFGACHYKIPQMFIGKHVTLKGFMKTENVEKGYAGLWIRVDGGGKTIVINNMKEDNIHGTNDWKEYSALVYLTDDAQSISFGGLLTGEGKMWLDDLKLFIDKTPLEQAKIKETQTRPNQIDPQFNKTSGYHTNSINSTQTENLSALAKTWGFLKYFHPAIAKGKYNMDSELFKILPMIVNCKSKEERSEKLLQWIEKFGEIPVCKKCKEPDTKEIYYATDLKWLNNDAIVTKQLSDKLNYIKDNRNQGEHYYVEINKYISNPEFKNEDAYADINNPDEGYKLLCLFRYWNMIHYFFPYKDIIGKDWNTILTQYIPKFIEAKDSISYRLTTLELIAEIHDTHANIWGGDEILENYKGDYYSPAQIKFIEDKAVCTGYFNKDLAEESLLKPGDIITIINSEKIEDLVKRKLPLTPASNYSTQLRDIGKHLLRSTDKTMTVTITRNGESKQLQIPLISKTKVNTYRDFSGPTDSCFMLIKNEIGYFNLGHIKKGDVSRLMKQCNNTKGIILDLRCYPSDFMVFEMDKYFLLKKAPFVVFTHGSLEYPGMMVWGDEIKNGRSQADFYPGKVIILVNEVTQSQAEYTTMALRTGPNTTVIGSTTAGADGNMSFIYLPGGIKTGISGLGVFYPNHNPTQRIGIIPDIEVKPTIKGIKEGRDEILEKAIELINSSK